MKTKVLSLRITEELELLVQSYAKERKWSISLTLNEILKEFFVSKEK